VKPFRERNPGSIGAVGLIVIALLIWAAFNAQNLPVIGGGTTYRAVFTEAGGLQTDDEVRVAGVAVGKVTDVSLVGDHVTVAFRVKHTWVGDESTAAIKIKTLLGERYVALDPQGAAKQSPKAVIPRSRTTAPYDVVQALSDLTTTTDKIDTEQLATAFDTLSADLAGTPANVRAAVTGLSRLSRTISSRDAQLRTLLARTRDVSGVLADRSGQLTQLITDGNLLLTEISKRRAVIHSLLVNTTALSQQLSGVVTDNQAQLKPAMQQLSGVLDVLKRNQSNLDASLKLLGPFVTVFANNLGNGRWFDTYVQNLLIPGPVDVGSITDGLCPSLDQLGSAVGDVTSGLGGTVAGLPGQVTGSLGQLCRGGGG
jgi:phospholipid/cholesterol/gamma-HCH transport system substrate-binding protein